MASRMITSNTTISTEDFLNDFAGRPNLPGYDETKTYKIADENRDFVWSIEMCMNLIISILTGFPIPLIVICDNTIMDGGNRATALKLWKENQFNVRVGDWEGNYDAMVANSRLFGRWNRCSIPITRIERASPDERAQIYENYNKGVNLTFGQLIKNRKSLPLPKLAYALVGRDDGFPFRELISNVWKSRWLETKTLSEVAFAYQIVVASMFGPNHFHTSFARHLDRMRNTTDEQVDLSNLRSICEVIQSADPTNTFAAKKKEIAFKKFIGAMIYDWFNERETFADKWRTLFTQAYTTITPDQMKQIVDVKTDRANNSSRVRRLSQNVSDFLNQTLGNNNDTYDYPDDDDDSTTV